MIRILCSLLLLTSLADAQPATRNGWSSWGVLPFRGYDFVVAKAPNRYVLYFTKYSDPAAKPRVVVPGRAFSTDMRNWTLDSSPRRARCFTSFS